MILLKIYIKSLLLIFFAALFLSGLLISIVENLPVLEGYKIMWEVIALRKNPFDADNPARLVIQSFIFISCWLIIPSRLLCYWIFKKKVVFKIIIDNKPNFQFKVVNDGTLVARNTVMKLHKKILCIYVDGRKVDKQDLERFQKVYHFEYEEIIKMYPIGNNVGYDHYDIQRGGAVITYLRGYLFWNVTQVIANFLRRDITVTVIANATLKITSGTVKKQKSFKYKHTFSGLLSPVSEWSTQFPPGWIRSKNEVKNLDFCERALFSLTRLGWCPNKIRATK